MTKLKLDFFWGKKSQCSFFPLIRIAAMHKMKKILIVLEKKILKIKILLGIRKKEIRLTIFEYSLNRQRNIF